MNSYLPRILETQPLETWRILDMSQGRAPEWASSTIFCRVESGRGRPLTNTPPSWFTPLCPVGAQSNTVEQLQLGRERAGGMGHTRKTTVSGQEKHISLFKCRILIKTRLSENEDSLRVRGRNVRTEHILPAYIP